EYVDERWPARGQGPIECGCEVLGRPDALAVTGHAHSRRGGPDPSVERPHPRGEVRVDHPGARGSARIVVLLMGHDRGVHTVVDDDDERCRTVSEGRGDLLTVHEEVPVAADRDGTPVRERQDRKSVV